jgi:hypothetical protein
MSTGTAPKETLPFTPEQKQVAAKVASTALRVTGLLLVLGLLQIVGGPLAWWLGKSDAAHPKVSLIAGILTLVQGLITAFLGLVLLATSSDFRYLGEYPPYSGNHLRNAAKNLKVFYQVQIALALVVALLVALRLAA